MMKFNEKDLNRNYRIIQEFVRRFRKELTVVGGVLVERVGACSCEDYVNFMNKLTIEEIIGNYLTSLMVPDGIEVYKRILNDEGVFWEEFSVLVSQDVAEEAMELVNSTYYM